jgi:hypothetical protein
VSVINRRSEVREAMMSVEASHEYARELSCRYQAARRTEKSSILDEFCRTCGYNRKYAIALLRDPPAKRTAAVKRTRARIYGKDVSSSLVKVWEASDRLCAKRLVPFLPELLEVLQRHKELELPTDMRTKLLAVSAATADRLLQPVRRQMNWRGLTTTKPGTILRRQIAVRTANDWSEDDPGYFEADLVAHCGTSTHGEYLNSLVLTDVATGWVEMEALLNKNQISVTSAIERIRKRLPFPTKGIDSDNGSEFINGTLHRYCKEHNITFTRCRPYKKNDQCRVEQKNWSVVRQRIGYARYEGSTECRHLACIYSYLRPFTNYLQPSVKLISVTRDGGKVHKTHDAAQTPYRRLIAKQLDEDTLKQLSEYYLTLNPVLLRKEYAAAFNRLEQAARVRITNEATNAP